jgi:hypothetical protein
MKTATAIDNHLKDNFAKFSKSREYSNSAIKVGYDKDESTYHILVVLDQLCENVISHADTLDSLIDDTLEYLNYFLDNETKMLMPVVLFYNHIKNSSYRRKCYLTYTTT